MEISSSNDSPARRYDDGMQPNPNSRAPDSSAAAAAAAQNGTTVAKRNVKRDANGNSRQLTPLRPGTRADKIAVTDVDSARISAATQTQFENYYMRSKFINANLSPGFQTQAANYIKDTIKKHTGLDIEPDKTWVNSFNGAQAQQDGDDGVTGFQHQHADLRESTTLTDFILRSGDDGWRSDTSGELNIHYGLYHDGSGANGYGAHNQVRLLPSDVRRMFSDGGLERQLAANQEAFWSTSQATWQMMAKTEFAGLARKALLDQQLSRHGYELAMRGGASNVPLDGAAKLMHVASDSSPDPSVQARRFDINGYAATDVLRFTARDGHEVLYVPGAKQPFYEFASEDALKDWVRDQARDPAARQELASHFSVYDRSKGGWGPFSATGVNEGLANLASGKWDGSSIDLGNQTIAGDVFRDMAQRMRERDRDDLAQISGNSDRRQIWLDDLKKSDSALFTRPIDRALAADDFAASVGADGGKRFDDAAGMDVGLMLLFGPLAKPASPAARDAAASAAATPDPGVSLSQKAFSVPDATPRNVPAAINEINERMQAIAGRNNVAQSNSLKELEKTRYGDEHRVGLERTRNALEEVYRRLEAANEKMHDPLHTKFIMQNLAKSLGTSDEAALSQAYARLRNIVTEAHDRFDAFRDNDYRNITFFYRRDDTKPLPDAARNNPVVAFSNPQDRDRLVVNLDAPDKGRYTMSESEASRKYNVELVDSLMSEMTRLAGDTQPLVKVLQQDTKNGFSMGSAATALEQFVMGRPGDAMVRRVLGKEPDIPDDASVAKLLGISKDEPVTDDMRTRARFTYHGARQQQRDSMAASMTWTYSDSDRTRARDMIRDDAMLRADLITSNADTAALLLRDIADDRPHDAPPADAIATRRHTWGVEDLAGTLHTFGSEAEADQFAAGALKRGLVGGLKNPFGSVMKIGGRVVGETPDRNNRLYEIGANLIGEGAAAVANAAGAPQRAQDAIKNIGDAAQYAIPYVGQARFYGGLAGKALEGEAPSAGDMLNTALDLKHIAHGAPAVGKTAVDGQPREDGAAATDAGRRTGEPAAGSNESAKQGAKQSAEKSAQPSNRFGAESGARALQSGAQAVLKFDPSKYFSDARNGVADGLSVEAVKRIDSNGGDLRNAVQSIRRDLKLPGPASDAVAQAVADQQQQPSWDNLKNYRADSTRKYTGATNDAIRAMESDAGSLRNGELAVLKMAVVDRNGNVDDSLVLVQQNIGNRKYHIYDPRNGVFTYDTARASADALDSYLKTAYRAQGELQPRSFTRYTAVASPAPSRAQPFFKPPEKLPDGRIGYLAGPTRPPKLPPDAPAQPGPSGIGGGGPRYVSAAQRIAIGNYLHANPREPDASVAIRFGVTADDVASVRNDRNRGPSRAGRPPVDPVTRDAVIAAIRAWPDASDYTIGQQFGLSASKVNVIRGEAGLRKPNPKRMISAQQQTEVVNYVLRNPSASLRQIAAATGVGVRSVRRVLATDPRLAQLVGERRAARPWLLPEGGRELAPARAQPAAQPGAGAAAGAQPQPSTSSAGPDLSEPLSPRRQQALEQIRDELDRAATAAVDDERVLGWMAQNLSDDQLEALERLPQDEFERAFRNIRAQLRGGGAAGAADPLATVAGSPQPGPSGIARPSAAKRPRIDTGSSSDSSSG